MVDPQHAQQCEQIRGEAERLLAHCQKINRTMADKQGDIASSNARISECESEYSTAFSALERAKSDLAAARSDYESHPHDQGKQARVGACDARCQEARGRLENVEGLKRQAVSERDKLVRRYEELAGQSSVAASNYQSKVYEFQALRCPGSI